VSPNTLTLEPPCLPGIGSPGLELRHLRYFLAVSETLNVSEASRRLRVAQPSLSRQIRDLEAEIGQLLFSRHKGRLSLTPAGEALRKEAAQIVPGVESAIARVRKTGSGSVIRLRVGYYGMMWATVVATALKQYRRLFPRAEAEFVELSPAEITVEFRKRALDVAVLGPGDARSSPNCVVIPIASVAARVALWSEHPLARRRTVALHELRDETFLTYVAEYAPGRDTPILKACRDAGFRPRLSREARGLPALLLLVAEHRGVAVVSPFARRAPNPGVVLIRLRSPGVMFEISAAYRKDASSAAKCLAELIAETGRRDLQSVR
jgi:DNA-binding transcriptional LysR family regulator